MARRKTKQAVTGASKSFSSSQKSNLVPEPTAVEKSVTPEIQQQADVETTIIRPADFLARLSELAPDVTGKLNRSEQLVLVRAIFGSIAQRLNEQEVGKLVVNYLGTFNIRINEKVDDTGSVQKVRRIAFKPKVVEERNTSL